MPITKVVTRKETITLLTLQEYADESVAEEFRQPLKTIREALVVHGWDRNPFPEDYRPVCCEQEVEIRSFLGDAYFAECKKCGKFVADVTGPSFRGSCMTMVDSSRVDVETNFEARWIAGQVAESSAAIAKAEGRQ